MSFATNQEMVSLKNRSAQLISVMRMKRAEAKEKPSNGEDDIAVEELRLLNNDFLNQKKALQVQLDDLEKQLVGHRAELARVRRELTICDQQDAALTETARTLEVKKEETGDNLVNKRTLETKLHDISHFKSSNHRKRLQLLHTRDETERELLRITQAVSMANNEKQQLDSRTRMIRTLHGASGNKFQSAAEEGIRVADNKRRELAATQPTELAGNGRFMGLQEVLSISDRSLQDVSSSLKEVRAAATAGDGPILEHVLEENLQLRKKINILIEEKRNQAEFGSYGEKEGGEIVKKGLLQFFEEARGPGRARAERAVEEPAPRASLSMFGFG